MKRLRLFTRGFFLTAHIVIAIFFLLACLAPQVNPAHWWPLAFFGLAFPFIAAAEIFMLIFWLFFDAKWVLLSVIVLVIGWKSLAAAFAWHFSSPPAEKTSESIRVMSYNVHYFRPYNDRPDKGHAVRNEILALIKNAHPDILCLEEFFTSENPHLFNFKSYISDSLGFPYRYFSSDRNYAHDDEHSGVIIFSKYPFLQTKKIKLENKADNESALSVDIKKGADTFRVFAMHLQSIHLNQKDLASIQQVEERKDSGLHASRTILGKLKRAFITRGEEADRIVPFIRQSPYPTIACGDFNDTPDSYTYFTVRGKMQDAFLKKGAGIGATYMSISPTLRIDYIFATRQWQVNSFQRIKRKLSDHYPIIADLSLKK